MMAKLLGEMDDGTLQSFVHNNTLVVVLVVICVTAVVITLIVKSHDV